MASSSSSFSSSSLESGSAARSDADEGDGNIYSRTVFQTRLRNSRSFRARSLLAVIDACLVVGELTFGPVDEQQLCCDSLPIIVQTDLAIDDDAISFASSSGMM
jgi:hypothetical protein